ncbi:hypothetical protein [Haloferax massiliensis]|uniref:Sulfatase n=1 Tax=Haloferax massiliensis TaxID=1476858 RepID=A0A0D6JLH0_9EURY|nr:hypothetical protein [Haloferax massiliensis]CQR48729.1 hypothetical protein BN996_00176 [Haloferax massiliensis]
MSGMSKKIGIALANPELFARAINRLYHTKLRETEFNHRGLNFMDQDWDNLIILDGCRYDTFERESNLPGQLSEVESLGSMTVEFLHGNLADRSMLDTVYVTGNGQFYHNSGSLNTSFYDVENVWSEDEFWDEQNHTVLPESMVHCGLQASKQYPNKRLIIHFIQPHYPFIDSDIEIDDAFDPDTPGFWMRLMRGQIDVSEEEIREAYRSNLRIALPHVEKLLTQLSGKTVVTSDHGNMLDERSSPIPIREWGHPQGIYTEELTKVPWLEYQNGPRKDITTGSTKHSDDEVDNETVEEHLKQLGYLS